jgi:CelD/BcsL family acetyltransferase involved in cellulose biosynthesis
LFDDNTQRQESEGGSVQLETAKSHVAYSVDVRAIDGFSELSAEERHVWNTLFEEQPGSLPFQSLFWNEAWWSVFGRSPRLIARQPIIIVLRFQDEIIAFFPMFRETLSILGVTLLGHVKPIGSDPNLTEVKTGIVRKGYEGDAYVALVSYFKRHGSRWKLITLPEIPAEVACECDYQTIEIPVMPMIEGFVVALTDDWSVFHRSLKRNVKEDIRRSNNRLKRDGLSPDFTCLSDAAAIGHALPEFYRLHSERANKQGGVYHPDYFQSKKARSFIQLLASDPAKSGIRLFVLKERGRVVAARLAFENPYSTYLYYSGYALDYEKYSIMTRLVIEVMKRSITCCQRYVHLSFGRDLSKTRWSPQTASYKQYLIVPDSTRGRVMAAIYLRRKKQR